MIDWQCEQQRRGCDGEEGDGGGEGGAHARDADELGPSEGGDEGSGCLCRGGDPEDGGDVALEHGAVEAHPDGECLRLGADRLRGLARLLVLRWQRSYWTADQPLLDHFFHPLPMARLP